MAAGSTVRPPTRRRRREEPTWELVYKRNSIERLKREKFPLDIVDELPQLIAMGYEAVPEEDIVRLNWWGLTHDKPKLGTFMVRIKVSGGLIQPAQLRGVGQIAQRYGRNYGELTTRQGIQLHWARLDQLPEVIAEIQATGLTTVGGEGDTVRNITGCPVAGIAQDEPFDVTPVIAEVADYFYGNREYSNLPRKHKYTIAACPGQCNAPEISDVALIGVVKDGREGFTLSVGGGLSNIPRLARDLGVFVPIDETIEVLRAVTDAWQSDPKYRVSRAKARIKFMMDDHGPEGVRAKVEERLGRRLEDHTAPEPADGVDHLGVHEQRQADRSYAGFSVPMGWLTGDQMIGIADLVEPFGGDIRLTRQQDLIVGNVPSGTLDDFLVGMDRLGLPITRNKVYGNSIACTSHKFCNYSVAETKGKLAEILEVLEARFGACVEDLKLFVDGCPHACAHHWIGDIGLQGTTTKDPLTGTRIEAYDVTLRGGLGRDAAIGAPLLRRVPTTDIIDVLVRLLDRWQERRAELNGAGAGFTFRAFCDATSDEQLRAIAAGQAVTGTPADASATDRIVVRVPGTLLELSDGADEIGLDAHTVGEALDRLARLHPRLTAYLVSGPGRINPAVNLYIGEDEIRGLGGFDATLEPGDELSILPALAGG
ncbi:MAG: MoaD/ThiS family protein [Actinobacteria bacterium]|nr:MoaD/ThiS family protein [Actinomycetota bacterium]